MKSKLIVNSPKEMIQNNWLVLKFGGSSVGDVKHWPTITQQIELTLNNGNHAFLVLSALKNVSNLLEGLLHQALTGVYPLAIEHLKEMHLTFSSQLGLDLSKVLVPWFEQLTNDCQQIYLHKKISPKLHARVLSIGELLSSTIGYQYLKSRNIHCQWQDARQLLVSNERSLQADDPWHHYTNTTCIYQNSKKDHAQIDQLKQTQFEVIVTQGFIAADSNGDTVLLGREGSDTSAAYFGALLQAKQIQIWTDVPGVFSCNPKDNNQARLLNQLNYAEASQMAQLGAKVLHPRALQPAFDCQIPIIVKSTHLPTYQGTIINSEITPLPAIKAIVDETPVLAFTSQMNLRNHPYQISDIKPQTDPFIKQLMSQGYDLVLDNFSEPSNAQALVLILRYNNSDQAEPDLAQLQQTLASCSIFKALEQSGNSILIQQKVSLVSIVGVAEDPQWQIAVEEFCQQQKHLDYIQLMTPVRSGRLSLLVAQEQSALWSRLLHQTFIEDHRFISDFGDAWTSFY